MLAAARSVSVQAWSLIQRAMPASAISDLKQFAFVDVPYTNTQLWLFWSIKEKQVCLKPPGT